MALGRCALLGGSFAGLLLVTCGVAFGAMGYTDRAGDVEAGAGPDIVSVTVSNTDTRITFAFRFASAPPLRIDAGEGWVDMLLVGVDVPPLGPRPVVPGGEWRGANFFLGTHGPSRTGQLVRPGSGESRRVATFAIVTRGPTLTFSIQRRALGNPAWFTFSAAAARETAAESSDGGVDVAPSNGTFRYALTR
jgi:hypothetical protein